MKKLCSNCRRFEETVSFFSRKKFVGPANTGASFVRTRTTIRRIGGGRVSPARLLAGILLQKLLALRTRKTMESVLLENKFYGSLDIPVMGIVKTAMPTRTRFTRLEFVGLYPTSHLTCQGCFRARKNERNTSQPRQPPPLGNSERAMKTTLLRHLPRL